MFIQLIQVCILKNMLKVNNVELYLYGTRKGTKKSSLMTKEWRSGTTRVHKKYIKEPSRLTRKMINYLALAIFSVVFIFNNR